VIAAFFGVIALSLFLAPLLAPPNSIPDLSGSPYVLDHPSTWSMYTLGDVFCHQVRDRCYIINGNQMPFCTRCTGIILGLFLGTFIAALFVPGIKDPPSIWLTLGCILPLVVDGTGQWLGYWVSINPLRLITGLAFGGIGGVYIILLVNLLRS